MNIYWRFFFWGSLRAALSSTKQQKTDIRLYRNHISNPRLIHVSFVLKTGGQKTYFTSLANRIPASSAISAPKKNGALAPNPVQLPTPCQSKPAINEAGSTVMPIAAL